MDVGNPSNSERVRDLYSDPKTLHQDLKALSVSDSEISKTIAEGIKTYGKIWCPHTATAVFGMQKLRRSDSIVVATAHPAKFEAIVEPIIGRPVPIPQGLQKLLERPMNATEIGTEISEVMGAELSFK